MKEVIKEFMEVSNVYMELMNKTEKVKRSYNGIELYPSEIHTLVFIEDNNDINMTDIAQKLGITKGAIFKTILKLEQKGLLTRFKRAENNKNTYIKLTEKGKMAYEGHERFHKEFFDEPSSDFVEFVSENKQVILNMFDYSKQYLIEHINKIEK